MKTQVKVEDATIIAFQKAAGDLWAAHADAIEDLLERSEDRKIKIGFVATLCAAGKIATLTTKIRWSELHSDEVTTDLDVDQMRLFGENN